MLAVAVSVPNFCLDRNRSIRDKGQSFECLDCDQGNLLNGIVIRLVAA